MTAGFSEWIEAVFDHAPSEPEWFWADTFDAEWEALGLSDGVTVDYLTRLFQDPSALSSYSLDQVAQGIWFLVGDSSPAQPSHAVVRPGVHLSARLACVRAIAEFFRSYVAVVAPGPLEHDSSPFHTACYMWWDIFPSWGGPGVTEPEIHRACLAVMGAILEIPADLCRLSALHGLNHWHLHYPVEVEALVDGLLTKTPGLTPFIREYAGAARKGCAQ